MKGHEKANSVRELAVSARLGEARRPGCQDQILGGGSLAWRWRPGAHYQAAKKTEKESNNGSWPAYSSRKLWDEVRVKTGSGKEFHHSVIPELAAKDESEPSL